MKETEKDFVEYLTEIGQTDFANQVRNYRRNIIQIHLDKEIPNIPVGKSKYGGYPDLPPEIPYPTMSGYTDIRGDQKKRYEACAMQLVLQIHLADLAAYDTENLLPHTGMLYFFWSGEIAPIHIKNGFYENIADDPSNADFQKVIWYDGDVSRLKRTKPPLPYYSKYFTETFEEIPVHFSSNTDYESLGYVLDREAFDTLAELAPDYDIDNLSCTADKLFGYPTGGNRPFIHPNTHLLLQYDYSEGFLWNLYWLIADADLKKRDFSKTSFEFDMD